MKPSNRLTRRFFIKGLGAIAAIPALERSARAEKAPAKAGSIKVLSCNIRSSAVATDKNTGDGWDMRKAMCVDIIQGQRADLVCLQECLGDQFDYLKGRMLEFESFGLSAPGEIFHPQNAILFSRSRFEMISAGGFWLSKSPHIAGTKSWDSAHSRFANWVDLKDRKHGKKFRLWNTHWDNKGQVARVEQCRVLCEGVEAAHSKNFPQLLAGDMNADVTNAAIANLKDRGWVDTYASVHGPADPGFTAHRFLGPKFPEQMNEAPIKGKIDWIFCRGAVRTLAAEVIRDGRNGRFPSDHYFISAEVMLGG